MKIQPYLIFIVFAFLTSCQSGSEEKKVVNNPPLFFAFRLWGEKGGDFMHCLLQVQQPEKTAAPGLMKASESVSVDGKILVADSTRYSGVFYQADLPIKEFSGEHTISYYSEEGRSHSDHFEFSPFFPGHQLDESLPSSGFSIPFSGFSPGKKTVNLIITDTAFATDDINELVTVSDGQLQVTSQMLKRLKKGPVQMQVILEEEKLLKIGKTRGRLQVSYSLSHDFTLI